MAELQRILKLLSDNNIEPKRSFGQNFLIDEPTISKIIDSLDVPSFDTVLEIGPGLGALTIPLQQKAKKMIAVEADRDMYSILSLQMKDKQNFTLVNAPFEHWDHCSLDNTNLLVAGNLPYNLTTKFLELTSCLGAKKLGFMLQEEVAKKIEFKQGSPDSNALASYLALLGDVSVVTYVPRGYFYPVPKVDSAFVKIDIKNNVDFKIYKVLKLIYMNPNKTLRNNIKNGFHSDALLSSLDVKYPDLLVKRAHQLSLNELKSLSEYISSQSVID